MATALPSPEFEVLSKLLLTAEAEVLQVLLQTQQLQGIVAVGVGGWVSSPAGKIDVAAVGHCRLMRLKRKGQ